MTRNDADVAEHNTGPRISSDHAHESMFAGHLLVGNVVATKTKDATTMLPAPPLVPRPIPPEEVRRRRDGGGEDDAFWSVVDGFVVDATDFVVRRRAHPGGARKVLSTDDPETGATGREFGFSFSRGTNAHFPETGRRFREGVERYLAGTGDGDDDGFLSPVEVDFSPHGKLVILGRLMSGEGESS